MSGPIYRRPDAWEDPPEDEPEFHNQYDDGDWAYDCWKDRRLDRDLAEMDLIDYQEIQDKRHDR